MAEINGGVSIGITECICAENGTPDNYVLLCVFDQAVFSDQLNFAACIFSGIVISNYPHDL
jgi:hypothetical protein